MPPSDHADPGGVVLSLSEGEVRAWIDGGVHLKAVTAFGDPVELSEVEVRKLIDGLNEFLRQLL